MAAITKIQDERQKGRAYSQVLDKIRSSLTILTALQMDGVSEEWTKFHKEVMGFEWSLHFELKIEDIEVPEHLLEKLLDQLDDDVELDHIDLRGMTVSVIPLTPNAKRVMRAGEALTAYAKLPHSLTTGFDTEH